MVPDPLSHVWQSPEDPARLQVYADWLLEHGDAARDEFMQLSVAFFSSLSSPPPAQAKRRKALRNKHRRDEHSPHRAGRCHGRNGGRSKMNRVLVESGRCLTMIVGG